MSVFDRLVDADPHARSVTRTSSLNSTSIRYAIATVVAAAAALALRLSPAGRMTLDDGRRLLYGPDSYDHLRRIELIVRDFPKFPLLDTWQGHPVGSPFLFGPLFDFTFALVARVLAVGGPADMSLAAVAFWLPAVIGVAAMLPVWLLARAGLGRGAALVSAALFVLLPAYLYDSFVGCVDNNLAEPIAAALILATLVRGMQRQEPLLRAAWPIGVTLSIALLLWRGGTLFWVIALGVLVLDALLAAFEGRRPSSLLVGAAAFGMAAVALGGLASAGLLTLKPVVSFRELSFFHAVLAMTAAVSLAAGHVGWAVVARRTSTVRVAVAALALAAPVAVATLGIPPVRAEVVGAARMMSQGDLWLLDNSEYAPILFPDPEGGIDVRGPTEALSLLFWGLPLGIGFALLRAVRVRQERAWLLAFAVSTATFLSATLSHLRFLNLLALDVALLAGIIVERQILPRRSRRHRILASVALLVLVSPALVTAARLPVARLGALDALQENLEMLDWLRLRTPIPGDRRDPTRPAAWGVLGSWSLGSWIENVAERPAVATNFGAEAHGLVESVQFSLADDEASAIAVLERNRVRYVIVENAIASLPIYARILNRPPGDYAQPDPRGFWAPGRKYMGLVTTSLLLSDGSPAEAMGLPLRPLRRFRLLFESSGDAGFDDLPRRIAKRKVFEYVRGARIEGAAPPGARVSLSIQLVTNRGRLLRYEDRAITDPTGRFAFTVPYATDPAPVPGPAARPLGRAQLTADGWMTEIEVPEDAVLSGRSLRVVLPRATSSRTMSQ